LAALVADMGLGPAQREERDFTRVFRHWCRSPTEQSPGICGLYLSNGILRFSPSLDKGEWGQAPLTLNSPFKDLVYAAAGVISGAPEVCVLTPVSTAAQLH